MAALATLAVLFTLSSLVAVVRSRQLSDAKATTQYWMDECLAARSTAQGRECNWCHEMGNRSYGKRSYGAAMRDHLNRYQQRAYAAEGKLVAAAHREKQLRQELNDLRAQPYTVTTQDGGAFVLYQQAQV